jgi:hypothetical protein
MRRSVVRGRCPLPPHSNNTLGWKKRCKHSYTALFSPVCYMHTVGIGAEKSGVSTATPEMFQLAHFGHWG